jgi:hypothetical protein
MSERRRVNDENMIIVAMRLPVVKNKAKNVVSLVSIFVYGYLR